MSATRRQQCQTSPAQVNGDKITTFFISGQRKLNNFEKYVLFSELNISVQSLNLFKICDSQRFASCVILHIKNRVGIRVL